MWHVGVVRVTPKVAAPHLPCSAVSAVQSATLLLCMALWSHLSSAHIRRSSGGCTRPWTCLQATYISMCCTTMQLLVSISKHLSSCVHRLYAHAAGCIVSPSGAGCAVDTVSVSSWNSNPPLSAGCCHACHQTHEAACARCIWA